MKGLGGGLGFMFGPAALFLGGGWVLINIVGPVLKFLSHPIIGG